MSASARSSGSESGATRDGAADGGARAAALHLAACAGLIGFGLALLWSARGLPTLPWYEPLERRWILTDVAPTHVAIDYYGRVGLALAAGVASGAVAWRVARRRAAGVTLLRAAAVWAIGLTLLGLLIYGIALATRVVVPPPLPPGATAVAK